MRKKEETKSKTEALKKSGNQGWPANYAGVMLQGFHWNSWEETSWEKLTEQSSELAKSFDIIWVPNSATVTSDEAHELEATSTGYDPLYWFRHNTIFGTEAQLRKMIKTFKRKGVGIIEDVVINHKKGKNDWCDFVNEEWRGQKVEWTMADICSSDESSEFFTVTGNRDEGDDFGAFRDLDHTSANVQKNVKIYLDFLLNDLGYRGFRYDMVKGYAGYYIGMYNDSSNPEFSVGEYWGEKAGIANWLRETGRYVSGDIGSADNSKFTPQSAAFDFSLKEVINKAFRSKFTPQALKDKGIAGWPGLSRWSVTFVDNHDTYRETEFVMDNARHILAANAFILTMPGTPCVFYPHWTAYKKALQHMIAARKTAGITNESAITVQEVVNKGKGYRLRVDGKNGAILLHLGEVKDDDLRGFRSVWHGDVDNDDFAMFVTLDCDLAVKRGERVVYFEAPADWGKELYCKVSKFNLDEPGDKMKQATCSATGNPIYKWVYKGTNKKNPAKVEFSDNKGNKTEIFNFSIRGYYNAEGKAFNVNAIDEEKK